MKEFLKQLSELSYEFFGFFLPGIALLLVGGEAAFLGLSLGAAPSWQHFLTDALSLTKVGFVIVAPALLIVAYLAAIYVRHLVEEGQWPKVEIKSEFWAHVTQSKFWAHVTQSKFWAPVLLMKCPRPAASYDTALTAVYQHVSEQLAKKLGYALDDNKRWTQFYPVARTLLRRSTRSTLIQNFQNKYTLARAMAYVVALGFWIHVIVCAALWLADAQRAALAVLVGALTCLWLLVPALQSYFRYYWTAWGSIVISEMALELAWIDPHLKQQANRD